MGREATALEPIPLEVLTDAVVALLRDDESARIVMLRQSASMRRFNVHAPLEYDPEPEGARGGYAKLHPEIGGHTLFGGLFEVPPGQSTRPYHYE